MKLVSIASKKMLNVNHGRNLIVHHALSCRLVTVASLPYWSRAWIVQEILLTKACYVVTKSGLVSWNTFRLLYLRGGPGGPGGSSRPEDERFLYVLCQAKKRVSRLDNGLCKPSELWKAKRFLVLLYFYTYTRGSDVRDRVYCLLGLAEEARGFAVDYGKSSATLLLDTL